MATAKKTKKGGKTQKLIRMAIIGVSHIAVKEIHNSVFEMDSLQDKPDAKTGETPNYNMKKLGLGAVATALGAASVMVDSDIVESIGTGVLTASLDKTVEEIKTGYKKANPSTTQAKTVGNLPEQSFFSLFEAPLNEDAANVRGLHDEQSAVMVK